ncbi:MAG TPA: tetratricopeptide repeat protein [Pyrinomonadaceae bacterium]|jgi:tetratricopeptide (TPR) repeat protein
MRSVTHYCQKCLAANPLGRELCGRCGTRLMLVVEPPAARYEDGSTGSAAHDEHLLERVSALENRLVRLTDKVEQGLDLLLRQARNSYYDHALIETLIGVLGDAGTVEAEEVDRLWRERCQQDAARQDLNGRREELREQITSGYRGSEPSDFEQCVYEGITLLNENKTIRGIRALERAAILSPDNAPLLALLGEHFFEVGESALAIDYLSRAFEAEPANEGVRLLLGLTYGDEGEVTRAKELLRGVVRRNDASFAAHYGLGRLHVAEQNWMGALREFKSALTARPSPEAHYVIGCVYYQLGRDRLAARHLRKALGLDKGYAAASYALGLVLLRSGEKERAREAFRDASRADADEPLYRRAARRSPLDAETSALPKLFGIRKGAGKKLLTGGDRRLAEALREDALHSARAEHGPR